MAIEPLITTVIPTYCRPTLLQRAIRSVLDQTYPHFKICVYDNASHDQTADVVNTLASHDSRVHYYCQSENIGAQNNFSFGLSQVDTPFVHLISDDDFLLPGFFAQAASALEKHPNAAFFSGGMLSADPDGQVRGLLRYGTDGEQVYCPPVLFKMLAPCTRTWTSALFRRSSLEALGGLRKETGYSFSIDVILRSATRFEAVLSDMPCAVFTVHPGSSSVAEASEAFESLLNLAFFDSINSAIDTARKDQLITENDADEMKMLVRNTTERNLFHGAFGLIARGHLRAADRASAILADRFRRKDMATVIKVAALDNGLGSGLRLTIRCAKLMRHFWLTTRRSVQYPGYSKLVRTRLLQLCA